MNALELIQNNKLEQAFDILVEYFKGTDADTYNNIIVQSGQYNGILKELRQGTQSRADVEVPMNRIRLNLIRWANQMNLEMETKQGMKVNGNGNTLIQGSNNSEININTRRVTEGGQPNPLSTYTNNQNTTTMITFDEKSLLEIQKENKRRPDNGLTVEATELLKQTNDYRLAKMANPDRYDKRGRKANSINKAIEELIEKAENTKFDREDNFEESVLNLLDGELTYKNLKLAYMKMATKGYSNESLLAQIKAKFDDEDTRINIADTLDDDLSALII